MKSTAPEWTCIGSLMRHVSTYVKESYGPSLGRLLQAVEFENPGAVLAKTDAFVAQGWSIGAK